MHLNNGQTLNDKLRAKESRLSQWVKDKVTDDEAVRRLFRMALCREPTATERERFRALMTSTTGTTDAARRETLEDLWWAVLTGREFLFNR